MAADAFMLLNEYSALVKGAWRMPILDAPREDIKLQIEAKRKAGKTILSEHESKQLLADFGFPMNASELAFSAEEAANVADRMGYPVVLKLHSVRPGQSSSSWVHCLLLPS